MVDLSSGQDHDRDSSEHESLILLSPGEDTAGRLWRLSADEILIGRSQHNEVCVDDPSVGRRQIRLSKQPRSGVRRLHDGRSSSGVRVCAPNGSWLDTWDEDFDLEDGTLINPGRLIFLYLRHSATWVPRLRFALTQRCWLTGAIRRKAFAHHLIGTKSTQVMEVKVAGTSSSDSYHFDERLVAVAIRHVQTVLPKGVVVGIGRCGFFLAGTLDGRTITALQAALERPFRLQEEDTLLMLQFQLRTHLSISAALEALNEDGVAELSEKAIEVPRPPCSACGAGLLLVLEMESPTLGCRACGGMFDLNIPHVWGSASDDALLFYQVA